MREWSDVSESVRRRKLLLGGSSEISEIQAKMAMSSAVCIDAILWIR